MKPPTWTKWWSRDFSLLRFYVAMEAIKSSFYKKHFNAHHTRLAVLPDGTFSAIYADEDEIQQTLENIYRAACGNFKTFEKYSQRVFQMMETFLIFNKKLTAKNPSLHSRVQLLALFKRWHAHYVNWQIGIWFHFLLEPIVTEKFLFHLAQYARKKKKSLAAYADSITAPEQMNAVTRESYGALKVAKKIKEYPKQKERLIAAHCKKFLWIPCYDFKDRQYDRMHFETNIARLLKLKKETIEKRLSSLEEKFKERKRMFKTILAGIDDLRLATVVSIMHRLVFYKDYRDDLRRQTGYYGKPFLTALAERLNITLEQINYLTPQEIERGIAGDPVTGTAIEQRMPSKYILWNTKQGIRFFTGTKMREIQAQQIIKRILEKDKATGKNTLTGNVGSRGKAHGRVVIVRHTSDLKKVRQGDIMVAVTTHPDYVPAMKKCAAIVTDEGGITSHAAIVARELHIPCIIGAKNATRVLKDGDVVEVNAKKGIVTKVS